MSNKLPASNEVLGTAKQRTFGWESRNEVISSELGSGVGMPEINSDEGTKGGIFYLMLIGLGAFIIWASIFEIDQAVRAQGTVIPSARTQVIQVADGGVLETLYVREGDTVVKGQQLAVLEKERASASFEEIRAAVASLRISLIRAQAEGAGRAPDFSGIDPEFSDIVDGQRELFQQNKQSLEDSLSIMNSMLALAEEEYQMNANLFATGDISRLDVMRTEREVNDLKGQRFRAVNEHKQVARKEAADLENELASAEFKLAERQALLDHTVLYAPVDGVIKFVAVNTLGGVLRMGDELMHISPSDGDVVVEVKVTPMDIGQLELGMPVSVKLDAFDFSIYGSLEGQLTYISSDTLTERTERGEESLYRAHISLSQGNGKIAMDDIKQGMTAIVDVTTGKRTVMEFIAKPIVRGFSGALLQK